MDRVPLGLIADPGRIALRPRPEGTSDCRKDACDLHVEFIATHTCRPDKVDKLKAMDVESIEIDIPGIGTSRYLYSTGG